jgi:hypothetical protein
MVVSARTPLTMPEMGHEAPEHVAIEVADDLHCVSLP